MADMSTELIEAMDVDPRDAGERDIWIEARDLDPREVASELAPYQLEPELVFKIAGLFAATTTKLGTMGECRIPDPAKPGTAELFPVLSNQGHFWECTHPAKHRTVEIVDKQ